MKTLTTNTNGLLNAVAVANTFTMKDGDYAGQIVLSGKDGELQVKASDFIQMIIFNKINFVSSDLTDANFQAFSINCKKLLTTLKAATTDEVQIELHPEYVVVKSGRSKVKVETLANTQEIEINVKGKKFNIGNEIGLMEQILHATDTNNPRFELNGVLLQSKGGIFNIVGTDTRRLAAVTLPTNMNDFEVVVPKVGINMIVKLFKGFNVDTEIDDVSMAVHTNTVSYATKLINGKFPQWQGIIPKDFTQRIMIPREKLEDLVKEASIFDDEIKISIKDNKIKITDFAGDTEVEDELIAENANVAFGISAKFALDFLASYNEENIQICFNAQNLPLMIIANPSYREVLMPIVIPDEIINNTDEEHQDAA